MAQNVTQVLSLETAKTAFSMVHRMWGRNHLHKSQLLSHILPEDVSTLLTFSSKSPFSDNKVRIYSVSAASISTFLFVHFPLLLFTAYSFILQGKSETFSFFFVSNCFRCMLSSIAKRARESSTHMQPFSLFFLLREKAASMLTQEIISTFILTRPEIQLRILLDLLNWRGFLGCTTQFCFRSGSVPGILCKRRKCFMYCTLYFPHVNKCTNSMVTINSKHYKHFTHLNKHFLT